MTNIYLVQFWDGFSDGCDFITGIFIDQQEALLYAQQYKLDHNEVITVEERVLGNQLGYHPDIYHRVHYDHTQALFSMVGWFPTELVLEEVIDLCIEHASPIFTEQIDIDRLYGLYLEAYGYYDD